MLLDHSALLLQICITVLLSFYVLQNYCFNCFTVGCVGWSKVLVLNKLSAELLLSSNYNVEQSGVTAPAALYCNLGHLGAWDPASAQAATWAPAGLSPCLSEHHSHFYTVLSVCFFTHRNKISIIQFYDRISTVLLLRHLFIPGF